MEIHKKLKWAAVGSQTYAYLRSCPSRAFSFLPNRRPIEDLIPFFLGALWRESWLLAALPSPRLSGSREADKLLENTRGQTARLDATPTRHTNLLSPYECQRRARRPAGFLPFRPPFLFSTVTYENLIFL